MSADPEVRPPKLRGWFHLGATPVVIIASLVLFILSRESLRFAVALYSITAIMLFSVSAVYHRVPWVPRKKKIWRRWDHANINLLIAGIYTPQLYREGGLWVLIPILIGGLLYSIGAIFYALKLPGRNAKYFGFHELFHIFVLAAWISQYLAVSFAIYRK